jgi:hypothetical protein
MDGTTYVIHEMSWRRSVGRPTKKSKVGTTYVESKKVATRPCEYLLAAKKPTATTYVQRSSVEGFNPVLGTDYIRTRSSRGDYFICTVSPTSGRHLKTHSASLHIVGVYTYINDVQTQTPFKYMYIVYLKSDYTRNAQTGVVLPLYYFFGLIRRAGCSFFLLLY